jgi:hypothetical protein
MREILKGFVDIHVHAGPSVAIRALDAADLLKRAKEAGYRGVLVKDHYFPTMMGCKMVQDHLGDGTVDVYGSIALNNSIGLFNLKAVDTAYNMGAKIVYFPTVSSKNHINAHKGNFAGAGNSSVEETPVVYVDENGVMDSNAIKVLEYMAGKDMALGTGHGTAWEIDHLVKKAVNLGVKRILVNHPHYHIGATYEQMSQWAKLGAYIELNVAVFAEGAKLGSVPWEVVGEILKTVPLNRIILDSDLGQKANGCPIEGMYNFIMLLMERNGLTVEDINLIGKSNPAALIGLD